MAKPCKKFEYNGVLYTKDDLLDVLVADKNVIEKYSRDGVAFRAAAIGLSNGQSIIAALESPVVTSLPHEIAHVFLEDQMTVDERQAFIDEYNNIFGDNTKDWNTDTSEFFARLYEKYLTNGRKLTAAEVKDTATRNKLQKAFDNFTEWAKNLYNSVIEYNNSKGVTKPINLTPQAQAFFDRVTGIQSQTQTTKDENIESESKTSKGEEGKMDTPLDKEQGRKESGTEEEVINKAVESVIGLKMEDLIKNPKAMMDYIASVKLGKKDCK